MQKILAALLTALLLLPIKGLAAEIQTKGANSDLPFVIVEGDLKPEDIGKFQTAVMGLTKAVVVFGSDGGTAITGIEIGKIIRLKNFATLVPDGVRCASACALAWLGGTPRLMAPKSQIGFHAAYKIENGRPLETGAGNALIGAYLNSIGLPERAIYYITSAPPDSLTFLNQAEAEKQGIAVNVFMPRMQAPSDAAPKPTAPYPADPQGEPAIAALTPEDEIDISQRLAANFDRAYMQNGIDGLNDSVIQCYRRSKELKTEKAVAYCYLLDVVTGQTDKQTSFFDDDQTGTFNDPKQILRRANAAFGELGLEKAEWRDKLKQWQKILPRVYDVMRRNRSGR